MYSIIYTEEAKSHLELLRRNEPTAFKKTANLLLELIDHPTTGEAQGDPEGRWSRRITKKHRLIYEIHDTEVIVLVLAAYGHYDDK